MRESDCLFLFLPFCFRRHRAIPDHYVFVSVDASHADSNLLSALSKAASGFILLALYFSPSYFPARIHYPSFKAFLTPLCFLMKLILPHFYSLLLTFFPRLFNVLIQTLEVPSLADHICPYPVAINRRGRAEPDVR